MRGSAWWIIGGMAGLAAVWLGGCAQGLASGPEVGSEPPPIADSEGQPVSFEGKVTVLEFWAVWCGPCKKSSPNVQALHERFEDNPDVQVIAVHVDTNYGSYESCSAYLDEHGYTYTVIADGREITGEYEIKTLPAVLVVGSDGTIIKRQWGLAKTDVDGMTRFINKYLADRAG